MGGAGTACVSAVRSGTPSAAGARSGSAEAFPRVAEAELLWPLALGLRLRRGPLRLRGAFGGMERVDCTWVGIIDKGGPVAILLI
jgi:hypothetical protein